MNGSISYQTTRRNQFWIQLTHYIHSWLPLPTTSAWKSSIVWKHARCIILVVQLDCWPCSSSTDLSEYRAFPLYGKADEFLGAMVTEQYNWQILWMDICSLSVIFSTSGWLDGQVSGDGIWWMMKMILGVITGTPGQWHSKVWIHVDSHVCMLISTLSIWTAISEYTQLFGCLRWTSKVECGCFKVVWSAQIFFMAAVLYVICILKFQWNFATVVGLFGGGQNCFGKIMHFEITFYGHVFSL